MHLSLFIGSRHTVQFEKTRVEESAGGLRGEAGLQERLEVSVCVWYL